MSERERERALPGQPYNDRDECTTRARELYRERRENLVYKVFKMWYTRYFFSRRGVKRGVLQLLTSEPAGGWYSVLSMFGGIEGRWGFYEYVIGRCGGGLIREERC